MTMTAYTDERIFAIGSGPGANFRAARCQVAHLKDPGDSCETSVFSRHAPEKVQNLSSTLESESLR